MSLNATAEDLIGSTEMKEALSKAVNDALSEKLAAIEHVGKLWYATLAGAVLLGAWVTGIQMGQAQMRVELDSLKAIDAKRVDEKVRDAERWGSVQSDIRTMKEDIKSIKSAVAVKP